MYLLIHLLLVVMAFYVVQSLACRQHSIYENRLVNSAKEVMFLLSLLFSLCGSVITQRAVDEFFGEVFRMAGSWVTLGPLRYA